MAENEKFTTAPDLVFIDAILLSCRLGHVRNEEQKAALQAAARAASDAMSFMVALENFGIGRRTDLHRFVGEIMASPAYYRARYPRMLGLRTDGKAAEPFLNNQYALSLSEPVLTSSQYQLLFKVYWWFVNNHQPNYYDPKKGHCIGVYATEPKDNSSTIPRFEDYLYRLVNNTAQHVRKRFDGFPSDIVMALLRRAFM